MFNPYLTCLIGPICLSIFLNLHQICPALDDAALIHMNAMLETIPVRSDVDQFIGIDYSLIDDPVVTSRSLDMHFRVKQLLFFQSCAAFSESNSDCVVSPGDVF